MDGMKNLNQFNKEPRDEPLADDCFNALAMMVQDMDPSPKDQKRKPKKAELEQRFRLRRRS